MEGERERETRRHFNEYVNVVGGAIKRDPVLRLCSLIVQLI